MSFAGHTKSINLHRSSYSEICNSSPARSAQTQKEELHEQLRAKAHELEKLKAILHQAPTQIETVPFKNFNTNPQNDEQSFITSPVDDRGNPPSRSLWIGNTPSGITTSQLRTKFGVYGNIESTKSLKDYSFVNFQDVDSAILAWRKCNEAELFEHGRPLWIRFTATQAESRKSKDWKLDRKFSTITRAKVASEQQVRHSFAERLHVPSTQSQDEVVWPNGPPPLQPKSHRREISPPPSRRADTYRPAHKLSHDLYRPGDISASSVASPTRPAWLNHSSHPEISDGSVSPSVLGLCSLSSGSPRSSPFPDDGSPLPWERAARKRKVELAEAVPPVEIFENSSEKSTKLPVVDKSVMVQTLDIHKVSEGLGFSNSGPRSLCAVPRDDHERSEQLIDTNSSDINHLIQPHNIEDDHRKDWKPTLTAVIADADVLHHSPEEYSSASLPLDSSPFLLPANKRLKIERDELSSVCSATSSLSNISGKDRRCHGCKKLGNEKGLQLLFKCANCTRRYHGFCGRPKPYDSAVRSLFVCGKCLRCVKNGKTDTAHALSLSNGGENANVHAAPLSGRDRNGYDLAPDQEQTSSDLTTLSASNKTNAQLRPNEDLTPSSRGDINKPLYAAADRNTMPLMQNNTDDNLTNEKQTEDFPSPEPVFENTKELVQKYKKVTCPWWRKGDRCFLSEEECLYAHQDTLVSLPDGFQSNQNWTCYFWLHHKQCPMGPKDCIYAHSDTGLHTTRDGRVSLKHITCYWWIARGACRHQDEDCRYAHSDTGLYSRDPSDKRSGNAILYHKPSSLSVGTTQSCMGVCPIQWHKERQPREMSAKGVFASRGEPSSDLHHEARSTDQEENSYSIPSLRTKAHPKTPVLQSGGKPVTESVLTLPSSPVSESKCSPRKAIVFAADTATINHESTIAKAITGIKPVSESTDTATIRELQLPRQSMNGKTADPRQRGNLDDPSCQRIDTKSVPLAHPKPTLRNSHCDRSTDPRKRLNSLTANDKMNNEQQRSGPVDTSSSDGQLSITVGEVHQHMATAEATDLSRVSSCPKGQNGTSYNKCKICAKIVFTGDTCRDCRGSEKSICTKSGATVTPTTVRATHHTKSPVNDVQPLDNIIESVQPDLLLVTRNLSATKQIQAPQMSLKRSNTSEDLFIPNKRPKSSMLFSSSARLQSRDAMGTQNPARVARASETIRKPPPPTLNQLLEKRRVENRSLPQVISPLRMLSRQRPAPFTCSSDKENETPTTEGEHSSLSPDIVDGQVGTVLHNTGADTSISFALNTSPRAPSFVAETEAASPDTTQDEGSTLVSEQNHLKLSTSSLMSADAVYEQNMDLDLEVTRPWNKYRCSMCVKKHRRCPHNEKGEESPPRLQKDPFPSKSPVVTQILSTKQDSWKRDNTQVVDRLLPYVCGSCRAHHKRCLHAEHARHLDPLKCRQYLRDRGSKRDTSRSQTEWESILNTADVDIEIPAVKPDREIGRCADDNRSKPESDNPPQDTLFNEKLGISVMEQRPYLDKANRKSYDPTSDCHFRQSAEPSRLRHSRLMGAESQSASSLVSTHGPNFRRDISHIQKLRKEGVVFESDEDDNDYASEVEVPHKSSEPWHDPLRSRPRQSRDLFEICPELRPQYLQNDIRLKHSRKAEWKELRARRLGERQKLLGNPHWEVSRHLPKVVVGTLMEHLIPALDAGFNKFSIPSIEQREVKVPFQEFIGAPVQPEACLTSDGTLAFRDGSIDFDPATLVRSLRGIGRRATDDDKFPVSTCGK